MDRGKIQALRGEVAVARDSAVEVRNRVDTGGVPYELIDEAGKMVAQIEKVDGLLSELWKRSD